MLCTGVLFTDKSLKDALFAEKFGFSKAAGMVETLQGASISQVYYDVLHCSCLERITAHLCSELRPAILRLFFQQTLSEDALAEKLHEAMKHQIIEQCGLVNTSDAQTSTEHHKEPKDKEVVRTLLVGLLPAKGKRVIYSDEVIFQLPANVTGPHGVVDLLVGRRSEEDGADAVEHLVVSMTCPTAATRLYLHEMVLGETKSAATTLAPVHPGGKDDIAVIVQPVLQLVTISQVMQGDPPHILFFANRNHIRLSYQAIPILTFF